MGTFHNSQLIGPPTGMIGFLRAVFSPFFFSTSCKFKSAGAACVQPRKFSNDSAPVTYLLGAAFAETNKSVVDIHCYSSGLCTQHPLSFLKTLILEKGPLLIQIGINLMLLCR